MDRAWMKWRGNKYLPLKLWMASKQCWLWCQNKAKWLSKQESPTLISLKRTLVVCFTSNSHDFRLAIWTALGPPIKDSQNFILWSQLLLNLKKKCSWGVLWMNTTTKLLLHIFIIICHPNYNLVCRYFIAVIINPN